MSWNFRLDDDIEQANSVNFENIIRYFNLQIISDINCSCPFHRDKSPSFRYYKDSNSFYCFSCHTGGQPVKFIEKYCKITEHEAVQFLLNNFEKNSSLITPKDHNQNKICLEFSNLIREFILTHNSIEELSHVEKICLAFDNLRDKYNLDSKALEVLVNKLKSKLEELN